MEKFHRNEYPLPGSSEIFQPHRNDGLTRAGSAQSNVICEIGKPVPNLEDQRRLSQESVAKIQETAYPWSLQHRRRGKCVCQCACGSSAKVKILEPLAKVQNNTSNLSSWRLLHMSRAKLKGSASTSELIAGFATVAMVELNIHDPTLVPEWLFVLFTATTSLLVSVHIFALMISTYVLPNIDAIFKVHLRGSIADSPHESMRRFIDIAWSFSTLLGLFLFLFDVAIICWIQLVDFSFAASLAGSIILGPVLIAFMALVVHFHKNLII